MKNEFKKDIVVFILGGLIYCGIELIFRGRTHFTMFLLAGCCSLVMAGLNNIFSFNMPFLIQVFISGFVCSVGEYIFGMLFNKNFTIWDYRNLSGTFANNQLNILFCILWLLLSMIGIPIMDYVEWKYFKEEPKPYYIIFGKKFYLY